MNMKQSLSGEAKGEQSPHNSQTRRPASYHSHCDNHIRQRLLNETRILSPAFIILSPLPRPTLAIHKETDTRAAQEIETKNVFPVLQVQTPTPKLVNQFEKHLRPFSRQNANNQLLKVRLRSISSATN